MKLKKCENCKIYTIEENCPKCKKETKNAHYKFLNLKDAEKSENSFFKKSK